MTPFYIQRLEGKRAWLDGDEARHCIKVMRKKTGDDVLAIDGKGNMHSTRIAALGKNSVELEVMATHENWGEKAQRIYLCVSPLHKVDRLEWLFEKAVELGVTDIIPYIGKHTVKTGIRLDRLERIMIAALKQSLRSRLPVIHELSSFKEMISIAEADTKLLAHVTLGKPFSDLNTDWKSLDSLALLVGPEGDFAEEELNFAIDSGYTAVELGKNRLRSETAAIHLLGISKFLMGF